MIRSISILHRHGARGPAASEVKPWNSEHPVSVQWQKHELEMITPLGKDIAGKLGLWFAIMIDKTFCCGGRKVKGMWRSSSSTRGRESGFDFCNAFNSYLKDSTGTLVLEDPLQPREYAGDQDLYFRPWHLRPHEVEKVMQEASRLEETTKMVHDSRELLTKIVEIADLREDLKLDLNKSLFACCQVYNIMQCELFWNNSDIRNNRDALCQLVKAKVGEKEFYSFMQKLEEQACFAWGKRFMNNHPLLTMLGKETFTHFLGDILDGSEERVCNIFSGHDYTILTLLATWGIKTSLTKSLGFASFLLFEVWEVDPETVCSGGIISPALPEFNCKGYGNSTSSISSSSTTIFTTTSSDHKPYLVVRVILNSCPFTPPDSTVDLAGGAGGYDRREICWAHTEVIAVVSETEIRSRMESLVNAI